MNREKFVKQLEKTAKLSEERRYNIISKMREYNSVFRNCVICIEELAELQQEITKVCRTGVNGEINYGLLEEIADVWICLNIILKIFNISSETLDSAIDVKLIRGEKRLNEEIEELRNLQGEIFPHDGDY